MLSHIVSPNNPSCATSPTSYTTPIGGTTTGDEDRTVITTQPLLVEQHASVAENNEVEVQYTKGPGKKVKLSRKSKNILFNPFKSSSVSVSGGVKEKSTMTAVVAETKKKEKTKKVKLQSDEICAIR
jgi:N-acetylmuramoyl-L-alanine amidase CwlA